MSNPSIEHWQVISVTQVASGGVPFTRDHVQHRGLIVTVESTLELSSAIWRVIGDPRVHVENVSGILAGAKNDVRVYAATIKGLGDALIVTLRRDQ